MDTPKISKLLRLMKLLTGNVSRTIDQLAKELGITPRTVYRYIETIREAGFVVNKLYCNVYAMGKVARGRHTTAKESAGRFSRILKSGSGLPLDEWGLSARTSCYSAGKARKIAECERFYIVPSKKELSRFDFRN